MAKTNKRRVAAWWADSNRREYYDENKKSTSTLFSQLDALGLWFLPGNKKLKSEFSDMLEKEKHDIVGV